jgi:SAM-dependent methyltransferase
VLPGEDFDDYAGSYDQDLGRGLRVTGEPAEYYAARRIEFLARKLEEAGVVARRAIDFGCGVGGTTPLLLRLPGLQSVLGLDVSERSIALAKQAQARPEIAFEVLRDHAPAADADLVYTNGVFHHVPRSERARALDHISRSLRRGGLLAFWENNPWNPGTRYVMSRIPFDRDAETISPPAARRMLREAGFVIRRTDTLFLFPRALRPLRALERLLCAAPIGGQYQVLCEKP